MVMRIIFLVLSISAFLATIVYADEPAAFKRQTPLLDSKGTDALGIAGVSVDCVILQDDSVQIVGSNSTNKDYDCDLVCKLKTRSGNDSDLKCKATLPAKTVNGVLCSLSGKFSSIVGGSASCK